ncbi:flavin-containing monooxygenase [Nocardioides marmoribigeumensis]|uniref:Flavoprotein involved in K+ transport n=1 Tax=Nocardioides marmoribigeumensis TaxID=433649 RepID=A0ABU2BU02_9ACTN|nr:FAD-dependent oxidoreductase [Nocardioides marmoribigeumensis]MDR7362108.1 putative flavoprotein involved in K+ transport [Nocardioides marmoribigeumensis]
MSTHINHHAEAPTAPFRRGRFDVLVIGAGQAGLAVGYHLQRAGLRFLIVDAAAELGATWRNRWDSLRLFTPAQYDGLPGMAFPARANTYPTRLEVADYLKTYAARFDLPVLLSTAVTRLERDPGGDGGFVAHTSQGRLHARQVVVATGPFQTPVIPVVGGDIGPGVRQLHSADYRNPSQIRPGRVVVVGGGNSGRQIALELASSRVGDHGVTLAVGTEEPELPQRILGRDLFWWLTKTRLLAKPADSRLARRMRARGDLVIGSPMQQLRAAGVDVRPRLLAAAGDTVTFADRTETRPTTVIWATGFRSDYSWIDIDGVVTDGGVRHERGISPVPGLSFIGLPWQHTRGSALLGFVKDDAVWLADRITARADSPAAAQRL